MFARGRLELKVVVLLKQNDTLGDVDRLSEEPHGHFERPLSQIRLPSEGRPRWLHSHLWGQLETKAVVLLR